MCRFTVWIMHTGDVPTRGIKGVVADPEGAYAPLSLFSALTKNTLEKIPTIFLICTVVGKKSRDSGLYSAVVHRSFI